MNTPQITKMPVDSIRCGERMRPTTPDRIHNLANSMAVIGLLTPITVRVIDGVKEFDGSITNGVPFLVTGMHRLEAAKIRGWKEIDAIVVTGDETDARLWEISENLHHAELTVQEKADHVAEWIRLKDKKHSAQVEPKLRREPRL